MENMCQLLCEKKRSLKGADRVRQIYKIDMFPRDWLSVVKHFHFSTL